MKKILIALLALAAVAAAVVVVLHVVTPFKEGNITIVKEMEKEGWKVLGTSLTLETVWAKHNELLETRKEIVAKAISSQKHMGTAKVQQAALMQYAEQQANITAVESNETSTTTTTEMVVNGDLELSFMIYREKTNDSGNTFYEFQGYYTINPSATLD